MRAFMLSLCAVVLLVGCVNRGNLRVERAGEAIDIFHAGKMIEQRHTIESRWGTPGSVSSVTCYPKQLTYDEFWGIPTCPGTTDPNASLAVELHEAYVHTAAYKDLVIPATITSLGYVAAFGTLGAVMPRTTFNDSSSGLNVRASTFAGEVPGGVPR